MATKIGSVVIDIEAKVTKLEADLAKANRTLSRFDKDARTIGGRVEGAFKKIGSAATVMTNTLAGFAAGIGVGLLQGGAKAILDFADDLATAADQANISVERFQTLKGAFRSLEVDATTYEKILQKLITAQGDVASGAENAATKALDKLGISAKILSGEIVTTDQTIDALAQSLGDIDSPAKRASIAADLVSAKFGTQLAAALGDGGKALKQAETDFRSAGKVIDTEMVAKLADANEKWDLLVEAIQTKSVILAADAITAFEAIGNAAGKLWDKYWAAQANFVLNNSWLYDDKTLQGAQDELIRQHRKMLDQIEADQKRTAARLASVNLTGLDWISGRTRVRLDPKDPNPTRSTGVRAAKGIFDDFAVGDIDGYLADLDASAKRATATLERMGRPLSDIVAEIDAANAANFQPLIDSLQRAGERMEYMREQAVGALGDALEDLTFSAGKNLDDIGKWFARLAVRMLVIEPILDRMRAKMEALSASGSGGTGLGGLFNTIVSSIGSIFGGGRAFGGSVDAGTTYLVGERGPEYFTPNVGGMVTPANDVGGGLTRVEIVPSQYFDARVQQISGQTVARAAPAIVQGSVATVRNGLRRNRKYLG
ncbi:hypothetical protein [Sphingosinicella microcystinivorans]|uniref:hypothetical protein n=1 Tax=Sphingosinicella microcystinivorans TaxID=335406 RepID=UPI0022F3BC77|nr:hypothetical protein [Sphingosinicella microcystinivorans]WBX83007.1 hypothetical protein PE061_14465 [Sphingosinicella microcystinivorans]